MIRHHCGLFAVMGHPHAPQLTRLGLHAIQSRGEESAGICFTSPFSEEQDRLTRIGGMGLVSEAIPLDVPKRHAAIGHVRYSTTGSSCADNIQPMMLPSNKVAIAHNGTLTNTKQLIDDFGGSPDSTDTELILRTYMMCSEDVQATLSELRGAFCLLWMDSNSITVVRDPIGFRPLSIGKLDDAIVLSSETCGFGVVGAEYVEDLQPGEIRRYSHFGELEEVAWMNAPYNVTAQCIFEHIYFADPASKLFGQNVHVVRKKMGHRLAEDSPVEADVVAPVPHSGIDASIGFAEVSSVPYGRVFTTNNYAGRSFIMPEQISREQKVAAKLRVIREMVQDKRVCLIEDSVVRGTTTRIMVKMLRDAGAKEVHMRVSSPPIRHACHFGIDFPDKKALVAHRRTIKQMEKQLQLDSLDFLSIEGMLSCMDNPTTSCTACFSGNYPYPLEETDS